MDIGDLDRFQKRRNLFKYLGGLKEFPRNPARALRQAGRKGLLATPHRDLPGRSAAVSRHG